MDLADQIAYVPQIAPKFNASVGEVIRAITPCSRDFAGCRRGLRQRGGNLTYERSSGRRSCNLSGGAKQKTLISLALASQASLYVLDEPTASLDTQLASGPVPFALQTNAGRYH